MDAGFVFATVSAGAERLWVSATCFLDPGPNCTVVLNKKEGGKWKATRILRAGDPLLVSALKKTRRTSK